MAFADYADTALSTVASLTRAGRGIYTKPAESKPEELLQLYEFEACPFCRLVREVLTELDLDAHVFPCPKNGVRYRPRVTELGGKAQFPFLVDPNSSVQMYESTDIIAYLYETYGRRPVPKSWGMRVPNLVSSGLASVARAGRGAKARPSLPAAEPLELYSIESSPFARRVRERLCELEIDYVLRNLGRTTLGESIPPLVRDRFNIEVPVETVARRAFLERAGRVMVPYLVDPNTNTEMFESAEIVTYLNEIYSAG